MTPAAAIAEIESSDLTADCRAWLIALARRQPDYRTELLRELNRLAGSYRMSMLLLDAAQYGYPAPRGMETAFLFAKQIVSIGCRIPPSEDALRKAVKRKTNVRILEPCIDKVCVR